MEAAAAPSYVCHFQLAYTGSQIGTSRLRGPFLSPPTYLQLHHLPFPEEGMNKKDFGFLQWIQSIQEYHFGWIVIQVRSRWNSLMFLRMRDPELCLLMIYSDKRTRCESFVFSYDVVGRNSSKQRSPHLQILATMKRLSSPLARA
jgi:hypothetical protein